jgi:hypothetical protein
VREKEARAIANDRRPVSGCDPGDSIRDLPSGRDLRHGAVPDRSFRIENRKRISAPHLRPTTMTVRQETSSHFLDSGSNHQDPLPC